MALNQFPYTNFHELNGDYVLQTVQQSAADAQAAQQSAQAAQQAAQTAAGQVTEANVKAAAALIAANEAKADATAANTKAEQALSQVQTATSAASAAAASAQTAQQAAGAAQTSASAADRSAQQAASDAERALTKAQEANVKATAALTAANEAEADATAADTKAEQALTLAQQALDDIPTADTMEWDPVPNNAYYIGTSPGNVGNALDTAYPKYIEFSQVGTINQFQATPATPINAIIPELNRGLRVGAIINRSSGLEIFTLSDVRIDADTIYLTWMSVFSRKLDILVLDCPRNATTLTAGLYSYDLTRLEV